MTGFWAGKRVLVTGHTGFKGSWLCLWLSQLGADVSGLSLLPNTDPSLYRLLAADDSGEIPVDIRDPVAVQNRVFKASPEIVFHLAAQPLVRASYREPAATFATNVLGTANLLDALRIAPDVRSIVVITTDKVYQNAESGRVFCEDDPLGGHDPYSASKAAAELVAASYRLSFFTERRIGLATARAGNVIGGGDWAEDRLIPDAYRAFSKNGVLAVRRPQSVRPWQHVLEPLSGYMALAERLYRDPALAGAFNFGPDIHSAASVGDVLALSVETLGHGNIESTVVESGPHEAGYLMLDSTKAADLLGFQPRFDLRQTIERTWAWYRGFMNGGNATDLCMADIAAFEAMAHVSKRAVA